MLKIGEFSKLVQVPVPTLRYYDHVGLLKPVEVDRFNGYRYYSASQLPRLHRILALKGLGFSLEQIGEVLAEGFRRSRCAACSACVMPRSASNLSRRKASLSKSKSVYSKLNGRRNFQCMTSC